MTYCRTESVRSLILAGLENSEDWQLENGKTKQNLHGYQAALRGMAAALQMIERDEVSASPASGRDGALREALEEKIEEIICSTVYDDGTGTIMDAPTAASMIADFFAARSPASPEPVAKILGYHHAWSGFDGDPCETVDDSDRPMGDDDVVTPLVSALATPMPSQEDRLREALERIADGKHYTSSYQCAVIARAALSTAAKEGGSDV